MRKSTVVAVVVLSWLPNPPLAAAGAGAVADRIGAVAALPDAPGPPAELRQRLALARAELLPAVDLLRRARTDLAAAAEAEPAAARQEQIREAARELAPLSSQADAALAAISDLAKLAGDGAGQAQLGQAYAALRGELAALSRSAETFFDRYSLDRRTRDDPDSPLTVVPAVHVSVTNTSEAMVFEVSADGTGEIGWTDLKPGEAREQVRLGENGRLVLRAMTWDRYRDQMITAYRRIGAGEMKQVRVLDERLPYLLRYGTETTFTLLRSTEERYDWSWDTITRMVLGKITTWAGIDAVTPSPVIESSRPSAAGALPAAIDDTLVWYLPRLEKSAITYQFTVTGAVDWSQVRQQARTVREEVTEISTGSLKIHFNTSN